jgi:adenine phosphoribosyltransferase
MQFDERLVRKSIVDVPDYPRKGVLFRDITPLLGNPLLFGSCIGELSKRISGKRVDYVAGIEARGFIIGSALAAKLGKGFIPVRKNGKLPRRSVEARYGLEYGEGAIEMHSDAIAGGEHVVVADDLLATGGTAGAAAKLVEELGGSVTAFVFIIELGALNGRAGLNGEVISLVRYP